MSAAKFLLGHVVSTPGALEFVSRDQMVAALSRHIQGDWGDMDADDRAENERRLKEGLRLFSSYRTRGGIKFWIITEADRSVTTVLLPDEN